MSQAGDFQPTDAPITDVDESTRIATDLPCRRCGYNLRGQQPDGRCPECGESVAWSTGEESLCNCDPEWVNSLAGGTTWLLWGVLAGVVSTVAWTLAIPLLVQSAREGKTSLPGIYAGCQLGRLVANLILLVGIWRITSPDPGQPAEDRSLSLRTIARWGILIYFVMSSLPGRLPVALLQVSSLVANAMYVIALVATCLLMRQLALRIADRTLAAWTRPFIVLLVLVQGAGLAMHTLVVAARWSAAGAMTGTAGAGILAVLRAQALVSRLGGFVLVVAAFLLLSRYRRAFRLASFEARVSSRETDSVPDD